MTSTTRRFSFDTVLRIPGRIRVFGANTWEKRRILWSSLASRIPLVLIAVTLLFAIWVMWAVPQHQVPITITDPSVRFPLEDAARRTIAQVFAGGFFFVTAYFTWRTVRTAEHNLRLTQQNFQISEDKHLSDRLTSAAQSLGSEKLPVRLGGIYTLQRVARDSEGDADTVIEILSAYIRDSRRLDRNDPALRSVESITPVPTDVQAAITVLGRCNHLRSDGISINLYKTDLSGADFSEGDFEGANFKACRLESVDFMFAKLRRASFTDAHLVRADLSGADLTGASMIGADLSGVDLEDRELLGVVIEKLGDPDRPRGAWVVTETVTDENYELACQVLKVLQ